MPLHVSSTCACRQEVRIILYSLWYHHTYRWPSRAIKINILKCTVSKITKKKCLCCANFTNPAHPRNNYMRCSYTIFYQFRIIIVEHNDRNSLRTKWRTAFNVPILISRLIYLIAFHTRKHCLIVTLTLLGTCQLFAEVYKTWQQKLLQKKCLQSG